MSKPLILLSLVCWFIAGVCPVASQASEIFGTEANPADLNDPFAYVVNPSLVEMTLDQVAAGYRILHLGLLDQATGLNTGQITYSGKRAFGGVAVGLGYLNTPLWDVRQFTLGWGKRIWQGLNIGLGGGLNQRAFDQDWMFVDDSSDPLLAGSLSRNVMTSRVALTWAQPLWGFTAGLVLENPHQPDVSFSGDNSDVLQQVWRLGVGFEDRGVHVLAGMTDNESGTHFGGSGRIFMVGGNSLTARFGQQSWGVGARFEVSDILHVDYEFSLPRSELATETSGTHSMAVCFHSFGRIEHADSYTHRDLIEHQYNPQLPAPRQLVLPEVKPFGLPLLKSRSDLFCVQATVDTALIRVKRLKREFKPWVDMAQIRQLPRWRIGVLDTTWSDQVSYSVIRNMQPVIPENELPKGSYTPEYMQSVSRIGEKLQQNKDSGVSIVASNEQLDRARYLASRMAQQGELDFESGNEQIGIYEMATPDDRDLWRRLNRPVGRDPIPPVEEVTLYQFERIPFLVHRVGPQDRVSKWTWRLCDSVGNTVRTLGGASAPPDTIWWDWRDDAGRIVPIDNYNYTYSWSHADESTFHLPSREILVARQVMQRSLVFGRNELPPQALREGETFIILDPGSRARNVNSDRKHNAHADSTSIQ